MFWGLSKPARTAADPVKRLEQIWERYGEVVSEALKGERKGEVVKLIRGHGTQIGTMIG